MNIRRGLFRFWILFSVGFVAIVFALSYGSLKREFEPNVTDNVWGKVASPLVPMECNLARGTEGTDYQKIAKKPWEKYWSKGEKNEFSDLVPFCWYELPKYREHYPDDNALTDEQIIYQTYTAVGAPTAPIKAPWKLLMRSIVYAFGIPVAVFVMGWGIMWAFAGFKTQHEN
jgi:hypothetical protein